MPDIILVCFPIPRERIDAARRHLPQFDWREAAPTDDAAISSATIIFGKPDIELLKSARNLKWQQNPSAGVEGWAASEAFLNGSFILTTAAGIRESCAQHAIALLLALSRRIHFYEKTLKPGAWRSPHDSERPL